MKTLLMKCIRGGYRKIFTPRFARWSWCADEELAETNRLITQLLQSDKPCYIGRIGTTEGAIVLNYLTVHSNKPLLYKLWEYITDDTRLPWWDKGLPFKNIQVCSGFFAENVGVKEMERFAELYLKYIPTMDLCGRFSYVEKFYPFSDDCKMAQLESLYPFFVKHTWMEALRGKKVLVVHPFKETILSQYEKREHLFPKDNWLTDFNLTVIKAVQTIAGQKSEFKDWFEALEYMKSEIRKVDFDVAIIGCGAYGLPLAGYVKEIGKKAIHMGGGTQLLFGIKGKRWTVDYKNSCYRDLYNEYWVHPNFSETPAEARKVEGACYW